MSPMRRAFISKWRSFSSSVFKTAIFSKRVVLAIPPQRTPSENNHLQCVCQLFEKLTTISNCTYYSHLRLLEQLYFKSRSRDCISFFASRNGSQHQALQSISHSRCRPVLVLGFTLLTLSLLTTSRLCCYFVSTDRASLNPPL